MNVIGDRIRQAREAKGLTQTELFESFVFCLFEISSLYCGLIEC